jgi:hypothetical protein
VPGAGISPGRVGHRAQGAHHGQDGRHGVRGGAGGGWPARRARPALPAAPYITHLVEFDYPERFVSEQAGHRYAATTAIYTGVSDDYRNRLLRRSLGRHAELWEEKT